MCTLRKAFLAATLCGLVSLGWAPPPVPIPLFSLVHEIKVDDPRIADVSVDHWLNDGSLFRVEFAFTQDARGRLVGTAFVIDQSTGQTYSFPISGNMSVRGTAPLRMSVRGGAGFGLARIGFEFRGELQGGTYEVRQTTVGFQKTQIFGESGPWEDETGLAIDNFALTIPGTTRQSGTALTELPWASFPYPATFVTNFGPSYLSSTIRGAANVSLFGVLDPEFEPRSFRLTLGYGSLTLDPGQIAVLLD